MILFNEWLPSAIGFTVLAALPLSLMTWWKGSRVLIDLVLHAAAVGGGILLLIELISASWHGFSEWYLPRLLGGIAALAIAVVAFRLRGPVEEVDRLTSALTVLSGIWFMFWFSAIAFDMWRYALRG